MEPFGRYAAEEIVGTGAMGVVYRARDPEIGRLVAVKVPTFPSGLPGERREEFRLRFVREARAAGALVHPGIAALHDVGRREDGTPYIVMEWLDGGPLSSRMKEGPGDPSEVFRRGAEVARALAAAHRAGIVHRDVKPANLLFSSEDTLKLVDFGVARLSDSDLTRDGALIGSPSYMAPEQVTGGPVDGRADLYALCAVLYHWLTGRYPHPGGDLKSLLYQIVHAEIAPPSSLRADLPAGADAVLLKGLARDPANRYADGDGLAADLEALAGRTRPVDEAAGDGVASRSSRRAWIIGAALIAALGVLIVVPRAIYENRATIAAAAKSVLPARAEVDVLLRHRLKDAMIEIRVNDRVAAERRIAAPRKPVSLFGKQIGTSADEEEIRIPVSVGTGPQSIEVKLVEDGDETSARISGDFAEGSKRNLVAEIRRFPRRIDLSWN